MDAQTKALKAHRKRLRARGMRRVEVVARAKDAALIRQFAARLRSGDAAARRLRAAVQGAVAGQQQTLVEMLYDPAIAGPAFDEVFEKMQSLEIQVPPGDAVVIRKAAAVLRDDPEEAARLRACLGLDAEANRPASALDVFAMDERLSAKAETLWNEAMAQIERERRDPALNRPRDLDL